MDFKDVVNSRRAVNFFDPEKPVSDALLDTHPMDGFDHDGVRKEFNIPENYWIPLLLAIGYFDEKKQLLPPKWRKSFDEIVVKFN